MTKPTINQAVCCANCFEYDSFTLTVIDCGLVVQCAHCLDVYSFDFDPQKVIAALADAGFGLPHEDADYLIQSGSSND